MIHKINRRQTLGILGASALLSTASSMKAADYSDLNTDRYLGEVDVLATIEDDKVFTEGPAFGYTSHHLGSRQLSCTVTYSSSYVEYMTLYWGIGWGGRGVSVTALTLISLSGAFARNEVTCSMHL